MASMGRRQFLLMGGATLALGAFAGGRILSRADAATAGAFEVTYTDAEWKKRLSPEQYKVLREHGTERAGSSPLDHEKRAGIFQCAGC